MPFAGRIERECSPSSSARQIVGPYAGGVHDDLRPHVDLGAVGLDRRAGHCTVRVLRQARDRCVVGDRRTLRGCRPSDGERETRVVGVRVVIEVRRRQPFHRHRRHVCESLVLAEPLVQLADAYAAGEVVHPHRRPECPRDLRVDEPVAGEDRDEEGEHPHEVWCGLAQALPLGEALVDEGVFALLEVAKPAVHELGRLGRGSRSEVVSFDERSAQPAGRRVEGNPRAGDAAAHHQHVEVLIAEPRERSRTIERGNRHRRSS